MPKDILNTSTYSWSTSYRTALEHYISISTDIDNDDDNNNNNDDNDGEEKRSRNFALKNKELDNIKINYLERYLTDFNKISLLKYLILTTQISNSESCMTFNPTEDINPDNLENTFYTRNIGKNLKSSIKNIFSSVMNFIVSKDCFREFDIDEEQIEKDVKIILETICLSKHNEKYICYIDNKETLLDICKELKIRGITIDPSCKNIEFKKMRRTGYHVPACYFRKFNIFFIIPEKLCRNISSDTYVYEVINNLPIVKNDPREEKQEMVDINGTLFSRDIIETIIESNFDDFVNNLVMETLINIKDEKDRQETFENGNLDSIEKVKLL